MLWQLLELQSYQIYHIYLFHHSKVCSYNNRRFTIDIWNFKIQNNLFYSFNYMERRICCWQELPEGFKALSSSTFVFECSFILYLCLKEAQSFFKFKYLLFILRLKKCFNSMFFISFNRTTRMNEIFGKIGLSL